jgi:hypothetical protein
MAFEFMNILRAKLNNQGDTLAAKDSRAESTRVLLRFGPCRLTGTARFVLSQ